MRAFDRVKGLLIPMLANVGAQSIFRAFEKTLTPVITASNCPLCSLIQLGYLALKGSRVSSFSTHGRSSSTRRLPSSLLGRATASRTKLVRFSIDFSIFIGFSLVFPLKREKS